MKIDLEKVSEDEPLRWQESQSISPDELDRQELLELSEVAARGEISRISSGHVLRATISYRQTVACVRCLKPIVMPVEGEATLLLEVGGPPQEVAELQLQTDDLDTLNLESPILDTRPILCEQVQLNIPMRSLCREDCAGLCPVCGSDLAEEACDCRQPPFDARWEALSRLRTTDEE